jgi:hypothetical protein
MHTVVDKIDKFIVIEVKRQDTDVVLFYSIDKLHNLGVLKNVPKNNYFTRKRFQDRDEAVKYLKAGVECLKKSKK